MFGSLLSPSDPEPMFATPAERAQQVERIKVPDGQCRRSRQRDQRGFRNCRPRLRRGPRVQIGRLAGQQSGRALRTSRAWWRCSPRIVAAIHGARRPLEDPSSRGPVGGCNELIGLVAIHRRDQRIAGGEMAVERSGPNTGDPRDLIEAGAGSLVRESRLRRFLSSRTRLRSASDMSASRTVVGCALIGHAKNSADETESISV